MLNPDLCPTHVAVMMPTISGRYDNAPAMICQYCKSIAGFRKMMIRYRIAKLKRTWCISMHPGKAGLFEGL